MSAHVGFRSFSHRYDDDVRYRVGTLQWSVVIFTALVALITAAAAAAIFAPLRYKWKGLLTAAAFDGLFTGTTGFSPFKKIFGLGR